MGTYKTGAENKVLGLGRPPVGSLDEPLALASVEFGARNDSVKGTVLLDADDLVHMGKVGAQVGEVRVVVAPVPRLPDLGPREFVLGHLGVHARARVAVPAPGAAEVAAGLVDDSLLAAIPEGLEHKDAG